MTDQTPSAQYSVPSTITTEIVRECASEFDVSLSGQGPAFDAWLATHDREVAAKALYDARDDWRKGGWAGTPHHHDRGRDRIAAAQYVGNWLDTRADRMEAGE